MNNEELKYSFRQFLIPIDHSQLQNSRMRNQIISGDILQAIGDASEPPSRSSLNEKIISLYKQLGKVIRPDNTYLVIWNFVIICIILLYVLELGMLLGFKEIFWQDELDNYLATHIIFIFILTADILLSPLKAYYDEGLLITDVGTIYRKYMSFEARIDILGLLSIILPIAEGSLEANWVKIVWLLKIYTASQINIEFERMTQLYILSNTFYLVVKLIVFCYIYAHFMSIGFYMVSMWVYTNNYYGPNTPNLCWVYNAWAFYQMALILTWPQMYTYIMYYGIAVTSTIAYGDITPKNPIECIYTIFALIIVTLIFGYLMTEILRLLITVFSYNFDRRFIHFELVSKLKSQNIQQSIQVQIRAHSEQIDRQEQYRNRQVQQKIMNFLPSEPLYGLLAVIYQYFLKDLGFYFGQASSKQLMLLRSKSLFLEKFMKEITEERHYTGDLMYKINETNYSKPNGHQVYYFTKEIYSGAIMMGLGETPILKSGKLDVLSNQRRNSFEINRVKNIFGENQFLNGQPRSHWAFCLSNCVVFVVSRHSLFDNYHLLTQSEKQVVFTKIQNSFESSCQFCKEDHFVLKCPYIFLNTSNLLERDRKALRKNRITKQSRTRLKTESSWTIYHSIREIRIKITKQYKEKLLLNKADHALFMELELEEEEQDEDFETKLHETEVMVQKIYDQFLEEVGKTSEIIEYDCVYQYNHYKPHNNINYLTSEMSHKKIKAVANQRSQSNAT